MSSCVNKISEVEQSICGEVIMLVFFGIFLGVDYNQGWMKQNRTSILVFIAYLAIYRIPINILNSYTLRTYKKESIAGLGCGFLSKTFLAGWMLYSMINYFKLDKQDWQSYWPMFLYLAYGFYILIQACIITCVGVFFLAFCCIYARRMNRPNWTGANNQLLDRLVRTRFTPANFNRDEACSVCLEDFKENDEVITLPCSDRHIFHSQCILEWLPRNNACPLCKEPVSVDNVQNQVRNQR